MSRRIPCRMCGGPANRLGPNQRYCEECSRALRNARSLSLHCDIPMYPLYRAIMRRIYGPGPWHPNQMAPHHRWERWSEITEAQAECSPLAAHH